ncbi:uncharacterized protein B0I36DRAFT_4157 [Microdochium trichocladiopsis]|uniref:Uncharacterized protein n=1 Tax=Microdochium trichocladiopsis TaxID=1682393 RepID=A0A9P8YGA7_9PEZI|nr:uncharacterized protein B0I36DRAFT_4157 [Microdochium trichocladiopsis]KAH7039981.1 hypothetical protein B0I36DRAFT_4157 [Microdochium trichocladiopsis]
MLCYSFSAPSPVPGVETVRFKPLSDDQGPIATVQFLYRSERSLVNQGITRRHHPYQHPSTTSPTLVKKEKTSHAPGAAVPLPHDTLALNTPKKKNKKKHEAPSPDAAAALLSPRLSRFKLQESADHEDGDGHIAGQQTTTPVPAPALAAAVARSARRQGRAATATARATPMSADNNNKGIRAYFLSKSNSPFTPNTPSVLARAASTSMVSASSSSSSSPFPSSSPSASSLPRCLNSAGKSSSAFTSPATPVTGPEPTLSFSRSSTSSPSPSPSLPSSPLGNQDCRRNNVV